PASSVLKPSFSRLTPNFSSRRKIHPRSSVPQPLPAMRQLMSHLKSLRQSPPILIDQAGKSVSVAVGIPPISTLSPARTRESNSAPAKFSSPAWTATARNPASISHSQPRFPTLFPSRSSPVVAQNPHSILLTFF